MKVLPGVILTFANQGRLTLQVPEQYLDLSRWEPPEVEDLPKYWFVWLKDNMPVIGLPDLHHGVMHLSHKGWEANKDALVEAFAKSYLMQPVKLPNGLMDGFEDKGYLDRIDDGRGDSFLRITGDSDKRRELFPEWAERWFDMVYSLSRQKLQRMRYDCVQFNMALEAATGKVA